MRCTTFLNPQPKIRFSNFFMMRNTFFHLFFFFPFTRCRLISLMQYLRFFCSPNVMLRFFHNRSSVPLEQIAASLFLSRRQRDCLFLIEAFSRAFSPALCLALQLFSQHLPAVI